MTHVPETIAAITTGSQGAVGIIRMSGSRARDIAADHFTPWPKKVESHRLYLGWWKDAQGNKLDQGLIVLMKGPNSYTGEDVVELNLHGGSLNLSRALDVCLQAGARVADPGEFTRRAFLNGKIDLTRAEAVADMIEASTEKALINARRHLDGDLYRVVMDIREQLLNLVARVEVNIDFIEEDVPVIAGGELGQEAEEIAQTIDNLLATFDRGKLLRDGARVVLTGHPNAGKSSLFNALIGRERAIVTPLPGTTRDVLEATVDLQGVPITLVDTAGVRDTEDEVERIGVERAREAVLDADLIVALIDGENPVRPDHTSEQTPTLWVTTKSDLGKLEQGKESLPISTLSGHNLDVLVDKIVSRLGVQSTEDSGILIARARHRDALRATSQSLHVAAEALRREQTPELVSVDLQEAISHLADLVGLTTIEDVLDRLFSSFCIGK